MPVYRTGRTEGKSCSVCPGFDLCFVPMVLNSSEVDWVIGHQKALSARGFVAALRFMLKRSLPL